MSNDRVDTTTVPRLLNIQTLNDSVSPTVFSSFSSFSDIPRPPSVQRPPFPQSCRPIQRPPSPRGPPPGIPRGPPPGIPRGPPPGIPRGPPPGIPRGPPPGIPRGPPPGIPPGIQKESFYENSGESIKKFKNKILEDLSFIPLHADPPSPSTVPQPPEIWYKH